MISGKDFRAFLKCTLGLFEIYDPHVSLETILLELDTGVISATNGHALIQLITNKKLGAGSYGIGIADIRKMHSQMKDKDDVFFVLNNRNIDFYNGQLQISCKIIFNDKSEYVKIDDLLAAVQSTPSSNDEVLLNPDYIIECLRHFNIVGNTLIFQVKENKGPLCLNFETKNNNLINALIMVDLLFS